MTVCVYNCDFLGAKVIISGNNAIVFDFLKHICINLYTFCNFFVIFLNFFSHLCEKLFERIQQHQGCLLNNLCTEGEVFFCHLQPVQFLFQEKVSNLSKVVLFVSISNDN